MKLKKINKKIYFSKIESERLYLVKIENSLEWIVGKFNFKDRENGIIDLYFFGNNYNYICRENNKKFFIFKEIFEIYDKELILNHIIKILSTEKNFRV